MSNDKIPPARAKTLEEFMTINPNPRPLEIPPKINELFSTLKIPAPADLDDVAEARGIGLKHLTLS